MDNDLHTKVNALRLLPIDNKIYKEHLKATEESGCKVSQFKYYKMFDSTPMFYSLNYLNNNSIEELVKKDKKNHKQFCPSFFMRLKMKFDVWQLKKMMRRR